MSAYIVLDIINKRSVFPHKYFVCHEIFHYILIVLLSKNYCQLVSRFCSLCFLMCVCLCVCMPVCRAEVMLEIKSASSLSLPSFFTYKERETDREANIHIPHIKCD